MAAETKLSKSIRETLTRLGYPVFRVQSGMIQKGRRWIHFAPSGTPDICGYHPSTGKFIGIEVKDGAETTDEQDDFLSRAKESGALVGVATSVEEALRIVGH